MAKGTVLAQRGLSPNVAFKRKELREREADYQLVADCIAGERSVKYRKTRYLPQPNPDDVSPANAARYEAYLTRAVFYNVTQRTLSGLVGEVFRRDPVAELPTGLDVVAEDADGAGLTLTQLAKKALRHTLAMGRAGVLADYPSVETEGGISKADVESGRIVPTITVYDALSIINWRTVKDAAKTVLTLVVLRELYDEDDDGFEVKQKTQYRVLRLTEGVYTVQIYRDGKALQEPKAVTDAEGATFDTIPFSFIGAENNDSEVDNAPMYDLASLNIAHYRNSADYEESAYMVGQPTPVFAGLTEEWVKNVLGDSVRLGSRGGVALPEGGSATLLQASPNTMPFEAMEHKERQMVALGAKLVESKQVQRTATEAGIDSASETSILSSTTRNVSAAIKFALEVCARFVGAGGAKIVYDLNTEFSISKLSAQEQAQVISAWQQEAITFSEMRNALRRDGVATLDDDAARTEIEEDVAFKNALHPDPLLDPNDPNADPNADPNDPTKKDPKDPNAGGA
jgi:hypothetical protein